LEPFLIIYPPLPEQSRIATVLSYFDDLIEVKKKQNEILEKTAMAIFKSWFIDFEPFRDGEFVYNEELGREIPKGWEVNKIEKEFYLIKGRKCKLSNVYFENYNPYLLIETFRTGKIEFWTIEKEPHVDENDVVLVGDGESSGKVFRYQKGILGSTLLALKPKRGNFIELKHLVYLTLKFYEDEIMSHRTGSAIPHLDKDFLKFFPILLPPSPILQSFHSLVEPLFQKIILNQKQIMTIRKIRDTLLPLLVFGKLRVEEL
jgi:type I restriction enzyme S subunit